MGDWSDVGHRHTDVVVYKSSYGLDDLKRIARRAKEKHGDWFWEICRESGHETLKEHEFEQLEELGIDVREILELTQDEDISQLYIDTSHLSDIFMEFLKTVEPTLEYKQIHENNVWNVDLGYGIFCE